MKAFRLLSIVERNYRPTTESKHSRPVADNLFQHDFTVSCQNSVGYRMPVPERSLSISSRTRLPDGRGIGHRHPAAGLIIDSNRGVQYACKDFRKVPKDHRPIQSMSRKGNRTDNAAIELFFESLI
jgi:transposase InsO family protein